MKTLQLFRMNSRGSNDTGCFENSKAGSEVDDHRQHGSADLL